MPASRVSWRNSASSTSRRRRSARRFGTIPAMPAPGPGWRPGSGTSFPSPTGPRSRSLLADPDLPPDQRWPLLFGLAHALDARGEFDRAAGLFAQANALQRADFEARGRGYDPDAHRSFVNRLIATFTPEFFERVRRVRAWRRSGRSSSSACRGRARRWSSRSWRAILASSARASCVWFARRSRHSRGTTGRPAACTARLRAPPRRRSRSAILAGRHLDALRGARTARPTGSSTRCRRTRSTWD